MKLDIHLNVRIFESQMDIRIEWILDPMTFESRILLYSAVKIKIFPLNPIYIWPELFILNSEIRTSI